MISLFTEFEGECRKLYAEIARLPEQCRKVFELIVLKDTIIDYKYQQSENGMMEIYVPEMIIKLKQGIGRLIRSESDKGIVSIIDSRVGKKSKAPYKQIIWDSLPIKSKTNKIEEIAAFYNQVVEQQKEGK